MRLSDAKSDFWQMAIQHILLQQLVCLQASDSRRTEHRVSIFRGSEKERCTLAMEIRNVVARLYVRYAETDEVTARDKDGLAGGDLERCASHSSEEGR